MDLDVETLLAQEPLFGHSDSGEVSWADYSVPRKVALGVAGDDYKMMSENDAGTQMPQGVETDWHD